MLSATSLKSHSRARTEHAARRRRREQNDIRPLYSDRVAGGKRRRLLYRLEIDERRLVVECCLQQIHLRLQQVALSLRDEERRRESHLIAPLLGIEALLRERGARARGVDTLGRAPHLPGSLPHGFGGLQLEARNPLRRLPALDLRARQARLFVAAPERITDRDADAPRRIVGAECLAERVGETSVARAGHDAREPSRAKE